MNDFGLPMRKCSVCGKEFVLSSPMWVYKIVRPNGKSKLTKYQCSYTCWRKAGGGNVEKKKREYARKQK
jgi:hypothetical protein